ncbi:hypothetical protein [Aliiroseovarius lamellibrachiae]|uniref:hypothetical protein n=1 Tax=Aliiroseovarius lamellibrachiae TaxID=1924933 RepID=UPI001BDFA00A|nr:hypothetical protein [Aliiroseovarius lamellibrachiae]MBT2132652.1 hypothetical protein [Aliiroseovarius lamellibrachiae]
MANQAYDMAYFSAQQYGGGKTRICAIVAQNPELNEVVVTYGAAKFGQHPVAQIDRLSVVYDRLPAISRHQEMKGIHPKLACQPRRLTFLGRRKAGQGHRLLLPDPYHSLRMAAVRLLLW